MPGHPFAAVTTPDDAYAFVSITSSNPRSPTGLQVLRCERGRYVAHRFLALEAEPSGMAMTHDGRLLVVSDGEYTAFVDVARAVQGRADVLRGYVRDNADDYAGAVYVAISPDDRYAFVSDEAQQAIAVIDMRRAPAANAVVGHVPVGSAPVALAFTRDGRYVLSTSQNARAEWNFAKECRPEGAAPSATPPPRARGALVVIDAVKAQTDAEHAVVSKTPAGCNPVRLALSPDGATAWASARASNSAFGFDVAKLIAGAADAQVAKVAVGNAPVPIAVTADGAFLLVGNSNRFATGPRPPQTVSVVKLNAPGGPAAAGTIPVGLFPREFSHARRTPDLLLSNWDSNAITVFDGTRIASLIRP